jgi:outer membrane protein TolC
MKDIAIVKRVHLKLTSLKMIQWVFVPALLLLSFFPTMAATESPSTEDLDLKLERSVTLGDLIQYAYQKNPTIQESREAWLMMVENYSLVTGYPDPELILRYFPEPIETRLGPQDWNATFSQKIPFPGKLTKAGELVESETHISKLELDKTVRDVIVFIRESFYELSYIRKAKTVAEENLKLLDHLRKIAETAHVQNRTNLMDMVKSQSQRGQIRYDILLLEDLEQTEIVRLNGLMSRPPDALLGELRIGAFLPVIFSLEEIYRLAAANQEEIRIAEIQVEKAGKRIELARYENLPDFKVGVFYAGIGNPDIPNPPPDAGQDALGIQAGITLPLWFGKNRSRVARARAEMKKAEAAKSARINDTNTQIRSLYFRLENAKRLIKLYGENLLPQAAKAIEIAETLFREGESTFADFIEAQAVFYNFQLALARAHADYGKSLARLERIVGHSITKENDRKGEIQ